MGLRVVLETSPFFSPSSSFQSGCSFTQSDGGMVRPCHFLASHSGDATISDTETAFPRKHLGVCFLVQKRRQPQKWKQQTSPCRSRSKSRDLQRPQNSREEGADQTRAFSLFSFLVWTSSFIEPTAIRGPQQGKRVKSSVKANDISPYAQSSVDECRLAIHPSKEE